MSTYKFVRLADDLDKMGLHYEAATVDLIIKISTTDIAPPIRRFFTEVIKRLANALHDPGNKMDPKSYDIIVNILESVLTSGRYTAQTIGPETMQYIGDVELGMVDGILALEDDLMKIIDYIRKEKDPEKLETLKRDQVSMSAKLKELKEKIKKIVYGHRAEDVKKLNKMVDYMDKRRQQRGESIRGIPAFGLEHV
jgi:hypothetical protein